MTYASRALLSSHLRYLVFDTPQSRAETVQRLYLARAIFPWDHYTRAGVASYYAAGRLYDERAVAIPVIEEELRHDPFSAALWIALIAYKLADLDEAGATEAVKRLQSFRRGIVLEKT